MAWSVGASMLCFALSPDGKTLVTGGVDANLLWYDAGTGAVKNLMTALSHRVGRDGLDEDLLHEIAAIIDEAAQKIERTK